MSTLSTFDYKPSFSTGIFGSFFYKPDNNKPENYKPSLSSGVFGTFFYQSVTNETSSYKPSLSSGVFGSFFYNSDNNKQENYKPSLSSGIFGSFFYNSVNNKQENYKPSLSSGIFGSFYYKNPIVHSKVSEIIEYDPYHIYKHFKIPKTVIEPEFKWPKEQKIVICGCGNAAHVFAGLASLNKNNDVCIFSLYKDEAEKFSKKNYKNLIIEFKTKNKKIKISPNVEIFATKNPQECLPDADIIILSVPAFVHEQYFEQISQHVGVNKETIIAVFPASSGLESEFKYYTQKYCKGHKYSLISFNTLPWACRVKKFGEFVEVLGIKEKLEVCIDFNKNNADKRIKKLSDIMYGFNGLDNYSIDNKMPDLVRLPNLLTVDFYNINMVVHSTIMYDYWSKWNGKPLHKAPLFYHGISKEGSNLMSDLSNDILTLSNILSKALNKYNLHKIYYISFPHIFDWYKQSYGNQSKNISTLYNLIKTNNAYKGLIHPIKKIHNNLYEPNFKYRYLTDDIPYGLCVIRGYALILQNIQEYKIQIENTQCLILIDKIIKWAQKILNKEYFIYDIDDDIIDVGKHIKETRAPQKYGFNTIQDLL